jgi:hypothetical protein
MLTTALFILLVILQLADVATTHYALRTGKAKESNAIMAWLMARLGVLTALVIAKIPFLAVAWFAGWWATALLCVYYVWVAWNNFRVIKSAA